MAIWHPETSNGITLLVAPGGGYQRVLIDREGSALATFFTSMGYTLAVMTYRSPYDGHHEGPDAPLADAQRAVRAARALTARPERKVHRDDGLFRRRARGRQPRHPFWRKIYPLQDQADSLSPRPDAMVLLYPVISMRDGLAHESSRTRLLGAWPDQKALMLIRWRRACTARRRRRC